MVADNMRTQVGGRYQLVREIGAGGMGRVFQAVDTETGRAVAAKVMNLHSENNLEALIRFHQEGALLSRLKHPNIVEVYGTFLEGETSSIIMELLEGSSLWQILSVERLSLGRTKHLMRQVCSALAYAHEYGVIHRDVKPGNIMVVGNDHVKVTDFGIARILNSGSTLRTMTGTSIGTPLYMAPEQIEGRGIDGRVDIYSAGVILYHIVTGRPPFEGEDPISVAFKHVHSAPQPPSTLNADIPADWEALILKALAKDPDDRFQRAEEMEEALSRLGGDEEPEEVVGRITEGQTAEAPSNPAPLSPPPETPEPATSMWSGTPEPATSLWAGAESVPGDGDSSAGAVAAAPEPAEAVHAEPAGETAAPRGASARWRPLGIGAAILAVLVIAGFTLSRALAPAHSASPTVTPPTPVPTVPPTTVTHRIVPSGQGVALVPWGSRGSQPGQFLNPTGSTLDSQGNIYVIDMGNNRIQKFSPSGRFLTQWGAKGSGPGQFANPEGIAIDQNGDVYVADTGNNRIQKFSPTGKHLDTWNGAGATAFKDPTAVALGRGNIYVADAGNNRIQELSRSGAPVNCWGSNPSCRSAQFAHPNAVAVDSLGDIYVVDRLDNTVQVFDPNGEGLNQLPQPGSGVQLQHPHGITLDSQGNIYVADTGNNRIVKFAPNGTVLAQWGGQGSQTVHLNGPTSARIDHQGNIFVVDSGNNRVAKLLFRGHSGQSKG